MSDRDPNIREPRQLRNQKYEQQTTTYSSCCYTLSAIFFYFSFHSWVWHKLVLDFLFSCFIFLILPLTVWPRVVLTWTSRASMIDVSNGEKRKKTPDNTTSTGRAGCTWSNFRSLISTWGEFEKFCGNPGRRKRYLSCSALSGGRRRRCQKAAALNSRLPLLVKAV